MRCKSMSQTKKWLKENWDWGFVIVFATVTTGVSWYLKDVIWTSKDMLQSLTQAEATVLSLFGIIVAYLLASYDTRLDRLEEQRPHAEEVEDFDAIDKRFRQIKERKRKTARGCLIIGFCLIVSLLLSVAIFGVRDLNDLSDISQRIRLMLGMFDILLFFCGACGIFLIFNRMGKEPEELKI